MNPWSASRQRIRCLLIKELIQIRRDRRLFGILLLAPLLQLLVLGYAATTDVKHIAVAVRDNDHTYYSREYIRALGSSGYLQTRLITQPDPEDQSLLVAGRAGLVLVIPRGFGQCLAAGKPASVQVLVDGADSNFAVQGLNYLQKATRLHSALLTRLATNPAGRRGTAPLPALIVESRVWFNPDLSSPLYMVPAVMGVLLLVTTMLVTSMALVKEREEGTLEQLIVTPLRPIELITGKLLPFVVIGFAEITLALPVVLLVFHVPLKGSIILFYFFSGLFLMNTLGLGLFISTLVKTQQQAMLVAAFFVMMPFILLSGFIFPVENMPPAIRAAAQFIPLKYYLTIVRGIFLKGAGLLELWPQALALLLWGAAILGLAVMKFHKKLD
ncbi:MAG: ABC transporter permease [Verrucomicrobia bacterium]|nr:ABC transporter permease [Verrucomicrobiota bacterium]MCG2681979.1 ABC transporter permease [Kiritimatiellia bacterium]MBU4248455.1 ABC transporter permease [Verrucomicrobiota bacterium]MBU4292357.1 ABC transporter permease [Verrucomicrobiota bacterium]MBU4428883.1 ABC transporter permease [Verrucomicrobiota bacterium]